LSSAATLLSTPSLPDALPICRGGRRLAQQGVQPAAEFQLAVQLDQRLALLRLRLQPVDIHLQLDVDLDGGQLVGQVGGLAVFGQDRKSTRLNSSHVKISYAVF